MPSTRRRIHSINEIAEGVFFVHGPESNWVVLCDADSVSLIDTGYPADHGLVLESIRATGRQPEQLRTILITHGHSDHTGNAARLGVEYGCEVLCHPDELANVRRHEKHQVGFGDVLANVFRFGVLGWTARAICSGGLRDVAVGAAKAFDPRDILVVSGHDIVVVASAGHTPGHAAYLIEREGVLVTGDCLVTAHPTSRLTGPQLLPPMFHTDADLAARALASLRQVLPRVIAPGHGPLAVVEGSFAALLVTATRTTLPGYRSLADCSSSPIVGSSAR